MSKLTFADLDQLRSEGHTVIVVGNQAEIGGRMFKIIGRRPAEPGNVSIVAEGKRIHGDL